MYDNDYSVSLLWVAGWLAVAALGGGVIALVRQPSLRRKLTIWWSLFPALAATTVCAILYLVMPEDRYLSTGGHWLIMLMVAVVVSLTYTPPWAFVVWISTKSVKRFRGERGRGANGS